MGNPDDDKEFEKFLMASISGSEGTSALTSARNLQSSGGKNLEWNLTSSEDLSPRRSRFLKTNDSKNLGGLLEDVLKSSVSEPVEEKGESLDESSSSTSDNRKSGVGGGDQSPDLEIFQKNNINFLSSSLTETNQTETDDRQEFANRLTQQHSALQSLGKAIPEQNGNENEEIRGTLEGLEEMKEVIEQVKSESQKSSSKEVSPNDNLESGDESILKSESIFSDASKSELNESVANSESVENESIADESVAPSESYSVTESNSTTKQEDHSGENDESKSEVSQKSTDTKTEVEPEMISAVSDVKSSDGFDVEKSDVDDDSLNESIKAPLYATDLSPVVVPSPSTEPGLPTDTIIVSKNTDQTPELDEQGGITITGEKDDESDNNEKLDKLFGTHKVNAIDIFDDNEADLSATKEISLAESSLVEMLNIYESKKNERSIENEFQVHIPESEKTFKKPLPKKDIKPKKTIELKKKAPSPKSTVHKPMDWSHVKGSGYGPSATSKRESRPKISPRLHQKVENVKRERIAQINKRQRKYKKIFTEITVSCNRKKWTFV